MTIGEVLSQHLLEIAKRLEEAGWEFNKIRSRVEAVLSFSDDVKLAVEICDGGWRIMIRPNVNSKTEKEIWFTFAPGEKNREVSEVFRRIYDAAEKDWYAKQVSHESEIAKRLSDALS